MFDCTVIGLGIAGTCMVHALLDRGLSVQVYDDTQGHKASIRAAGVINPITGRRFVKTWKADEVIPLSRSFYRSIESKFGVSGLVEDRGILHSMNEPIMEENWMLREGEEEYVKYMGQMVRGVNPAIAHSGWFGELNGALQVNMAEVLRVTRLWVQERHILKEEVLKHYTTRTADLAENLDSRFVIFTEGMAVRANPYFNFLPHHVSKGEALICQIPDLETDLIIKGEGLSVAPLWEQDLYWVGSTYDWNDEDPAPTAKARQQLEQKLTALLTCPYEVVEHIAGIRPTTQDRRPYVGVHPEYENLFLLNGLGTKGASLAPYCAETLAEHIVNDVPIPEEMDLLRYAR